METPPFKLLIVEDDPDAAELVAQAFTEFCAEPIAVFLAFDGEQAVDLAVSKVPDGALVDLEMPKLDGIAAAFRIRDAVPGPPAMLVAYTGASSLAPRADAAPVFDHILRKPADIRQLIAIFGLTCKSSLREVQPGVGQD